MAACGRKKDIEAFLEAYRELEEALAAPDVRPLSSGLLRPGAGASSVYDLEQGMADQGAADKVRLCRSLRNYAAHHPGADGFAACTPEMAAFLRGIARALLDTRARAGDAMRRIRPLRPSDTVGGAAKALLSRKAPYIPVAGDRGEALLVADDSLISRCAGAGVPMDAPLSECGQGSARPYLYAGADAVVSSLKPGDYVILGAGARPAGILSRRGGLG